MAMVPLTSVLLLFLAGASALTADFNNQAWKERPVARVIRLLEEMKDQLEKEAEEDEKIYDAMVCWCETNEKAKTKAVGDGTERDKQLTSLIPELAAKSAQLKVEIEAAQKELAKNKEALAEATEIRAKELGEFREEEKTAVQSIGGLKNAVMALEKHHALNQETFLQVRQAIETRAHKLPNHGADLLRKLGLHSEQRKAVEAFLQLDNQGPVPSSHSSSSGEIFGILKGMKESFEQNLQQSQVEEKEGAETFVSIKASKEQEISAGTAQIKNKVQELADTDEKLANSKEELVDTREQVTADQAFLLDLQERCGNMDKQFSDRQKIRGDEVKAVNEALKILTDDDAHDLFSRSTGFVQTSMTTSSKREKVVAFLKSAAKRLQSPTLSMLAIALKEDVFAKIKETIDDMVVQLTKEMEDEVALRDQCIDDLNTNEKQVAAKHSQKKDLETLIEDLTLTITKLAEEIQMAKDEIAETEKEKLKASENRELQNKDYQATIADQRATQELLTKALGKLKAFYDAAALLQVKALAARKTGQAPPEFGEYKKAGGSGGVMGMMETIIDESKQEEAEAVASETEGQAAYEQFIKDSNASIKALNKSINDKTAAMGKADADKLRAEADLKTVDDDIAALEGLRDELHSNCDFLLKNFEARQSAREQEKEALAQAKAVMSGADV